MGEIRNIHSFDSSRQGCLLPDCTDYVSKEESSRSERSKVLAVLIKNLRAMLGNSPL